MEKNEFRESPTVALIQIADGWPSLTKSFCKPDNFRHGRRKYYLTPRFHSTYVTKASFTYDEVTVFVIQ